MYFNIHIAWCHKKPFSKGIKITEPKLLVIVHFKKWTIYFILFFGYLRQGFPVALVSVLELAL